MSTPKVQIRILGKSKTRFLRLISVIGLFLRLGNNIPIKAPIIVAITQILVPILFFDMAPRPFVYYIVLCINKYKIQKSYLKTHL